jgi:hypothetical protein
VTSLLVRRDDLHQIQFDDSPSASLAGGEARLAIDAFALTANNITYGVFGDAMQYWHFFPAPDPWGRIPVWGFADVESSRRRTASTRASATTATSRWRTSSWSGPVG